MASYEYSAINEGGKRVEGIVDGDSERDANAKLLAKKLYPVKVSAVAERRASASNNRKTKLSTTELTIITRQLATLLGSGLTVEDALTAIARQARSIKTKGVISDLRGLIMEGFSMSDAVKTYPKTFENLYAACIVAGEQSGKLDIVFDRLADYLEQRQDVRQKLSTALIYPVFLLFSSLAIVTALVAYVVPKVVTVFIDSGNELPVVTKALIASSDFLVEYGLFLVLGILLLFLALRLLLSQPRNRYHFDLSLLSVIGIGNLIRSSDSASMARTLSIMIGSGVPLLNAIKAASGVVRNAALKEDIIEAGTEIAEGVSISRSLDRHRRFPPLLIQMVATGENNGELAQMLERVAKSMESETQSRLSTFVSLFEPIMILIMGALVLVIVLAILMPIFDLNQALV